MRTLVVVPTYNEAETIVALLEAVRAAAPSVDVLVVDDGSPDGTGKLAEDAGARLGRIEVLHRDGQGRARHGLPRGVRARPRARATTRFVEMDADFSHDPSALPTLLDAAEDYEVVIGSRYVPGAAIPNWTLARLALSRGGNLYASLLLVAPRRGLDRGLPRLPAQRARADRLRDGPRRRATPSRSR